MFLLEDEIADAALEFAQKFADIRRRRVVLFGADPFAALDIPRTALVHRLQQVLLNLTLRLREMYVERSLREEQASLTLAEVAGPLRTSAAAIIELERGESKAPKEALEIVIRELERDDLAALLPHLPEAREQRALPAEPESWSEHLAFVRAGGIEIGHLAAPPRNDETMEGLMRNVDAARRVVGSLPLLENVATLIDPPFSDYAEAEWLNLVLRATGADLLLDLHNLHANATNFGFDARAVVASIANDRVGAIHLAGGRRIEGNRILDDHLHAIPSEVFALLALVAAGETTVIIERDGNYPPFAELLLEVEHARRSAAISGAAVRG